MDGQKFSEDVSTLNGMQMLDRITQYYGGTWNPRRALNEMTAAGWTTTSRYPLNLMGNMLSRLADRGVLVRYGNGVYERF